MAPKEPQFFEVPADTHARRCRGCSATVFWIETAAGKLMPVHCDTAGGVRPVRGGSPDRAQDVAGRGISHFVDCPNAGRFRRAR